MFFNFLKQNSIYWKVALGYLFGYLVTLNLYSSIGGSIAYPFFIDIFIARTGLMAIFTFSLYFFIIVGLINYAVFAFHNYKK
jgi:hypothetical protein